MGFAPAHPPRRGPQTSGTHFFPCPHGQRMGKLTRPGFGLPAGPRPGSLPFPHELGGGGRAANPLRFSVWRDGDGAAEQGCDHRVTRRIRNERASRRGVSRKNSPSKKNGRPPVRLGPEPPAASPRDAKERGRCPRRLWGHPGWGWRRQFPEIHRPQEPSVSFCS